MPNWTTTCVTLRHFSSKKIKALKDEIRKKDPQILNHLRPQPDNMFHGDVNDEIAKAYREKGRPNWHDWNLEFWGTKWDAKRVEINFSTMNTIELKFQTAYDPPIEWFDHICSKGWKVDAIYREETGYFVGVYKNGVNKKLTNPVDAYINQDAPQWLLDEWEYEFISDLWDQDRINEKGDLLDDDGKIIKEFGTWGTDDVITEYVGKQLAVREIL